MRGVGLLGKKKTTRSVEVDKRRRNYLFHVPPGYGGSKPILAILAFQG